MLNNITITNAINKDNILYKINPIIKILSIVLILFFSLFCKNIYSHLIIMTIILFLIYLSKIDIKIYLKLIKQSQYFLIVIFIFNLFFINVYDSLISIFRIIELLIYSNVILHTTNISSMNFGLTTLCSPLKLFKLNPLFFSISITLTIRFIPIILNETRNILKSLQLRGIYFTNNFKKNIWIVSKIIKPILKNAIAKADNIANMMEVKHFSFEKNRSNYFTYKINAFDILFIIILLLISIILLRSEIL